MIQVIGGLADLLLAFEVCEMPLDALFELAQELRRDRPQQRVLFGLAIWQWLSELLYSVSSHRYISWSLAFLCLTCSSSSGKNWVMLLSRTLVSELTRALVPRQEGGREE